MSKSPTNSPVERSGPASARVTIQAAGLLIVLAGALVYSNSFEGPFIFDDFKSIPENPTIRSLWPPWSALSPPDSGDAIQDRPIVNLSLAINYAIGELDVWIYHLFNLAVHILAALTLFGIIRRTLRLPVIPESIAAGAAPMALISALIWTVHPLQTEAVTYIIQRTESMMGLFYLLTLYCAIRGAGASSPARWYLAAVAACTLGMGTKETMVSVPLVVLVYDRVFLARSFREVFHRRWPLHVGLAATWGLLSALVIPSGGRSILLGYGYWEALRSYIPMQFSNIVHYLRLSFWPHPLIVDYGVVPVGKVELNVLHVIIVVVVLAGALAAFRYKPHFGFLGLWFFAILAPSSSIMPLLIQPAAEKRMYLPLAAVIVAVVVCAYAIGRRVVNRPADSKIQATAAGWLVGIGLVAIVVLILGYLTVVRNHDYRSEFAIWDDTIAKNPHNWRAFANRGYARARGSDYDLAMGDYTEAIRRLKRISRPSSHFHRREAHLHRHRAVTYSALGQYEKAWADVATCRRLGGTVRPDFLAILRKVSGRQE
jgi:hypothetical protein